jgi:hypothetical protein
MRQLAFIADDFGLSEDINLAIVRAHAQGALSGASLMPGQPATAHAVALARQHPTLEIGWHLHLCDSVPVTCAAWPWSDSPWRAGLRLGATMARRQRLAEELAAQWRLFQATGLRCAFVNSHHHLHVHPVVLRELRRLWPAGFGGWVRGFRLRWFGSGSCLRTRGLWLAAPLARRALRQSGFRLSDTLWGLDRTFTMQAREVRAAMAGLTEGLHEFIFHPRAPQGDADLAALLELRAQPTESGPVPKPR